MTVKIKSVVDHTADFLKATKVLASSQVLVGVPAEKAPRSSAEAKGQPINNAALAYIHNYGIPELNIPARPFLEPGIKNAKDRINGYMGDAAAAAFDGKSERVAKNLTAAGIAATSSVKSKINTGPFQPLRPATLAARRARGRTGTKPLIDTGQLRNSISFVVRKK